MDGELHQCGAVYRAAGGGGLLRRDGELLLFHLSESLKQKAENAISSFDYYRTEAEYYDNARAVVAGEPNSDKLEVEYLDADGQIRFSSSDLTAFRSPGTPDIAEAISMKRTKVWIGADPQHRRAHHGRLQPLMIDGRWLGSCGMSPP